MKNSYLISLAIATLAVGCLLVFSSAKAFDVKMARHAAGVGIPDDVMKVFQNSCMKCHATGGSGMAAAMVNFSVWDTYSAKKQAK
jgi:hypothetical protein